MRLVEDLDRAFLGNLHDALFKLFALHGVDAFHRSKVFRSEARDSFVADVHPFFAYGVSDGKDPGIEHADDISRKGLINDGAVRSHELLRLGQAKSLCPLYVVVFPVSLEASGADAHKGNAVTVCLVHICLNLENKGRKRV